MAILYPSELAHGQNPKPPGTLTGLSCKLFLRKARCKISFKEIMEAGHLVCVICGPRCLSMFRSLILGAVRLRTALPYAGTCHTEPHLQPRVTNMSSSCTAADPNNKEQSIIRICDVKCGSMNWPSMSGNCRQKSSRLTPSATIGMILTKINGQQWASLLNTCALCRLLRPPQHTWRYVRFKSVFRGALANGFKSLLSR